ncbi:MAG: hypothetical protein HOH66_17295 [Rhodospirillaceae bacterium]|jgi:hypothetical protein|nr:hypothetical protein [Rhodospirillaceae bacterium]MBT6119620.1 hypothetical protein [Rhodospirillaceae bacterium]
MTRQFALALLVLAAVAPALAAESDSVRVNASRYQPVPDGVAVSIAFANPAQKDRDLETLLAERLLIGGHEVVEEGGYGLVVDYDAPQRNEENKTFHIEGGTDRRGMDRMRMSLNFQLSEPKGTSDTSLTQAWMALHDPTGKRIWEGVASTRRPKRAPFAAPEELLLPLVDRLGENIRGETVTPN